MTFTGVIPLQAPMPAGYVRVWISDTLPSAVSQFYTSSVWPVDLEGGTRTGGPALVERSARPGGPRATSAEACDYRVAGTDFRWRGDFRGWRRLSAAVSISEASPTFVPAATFAAAATSWRRRLSSAGWNIRGGGTSAARYLRGGGDFRGGGDIRGGSPLRSWGAEHTRVRRAGAFSRRPGHSVQRRQHLR